jgi:hypothetical protein
VDFGFCLIDKFAPIRKRALAVKKVKKKERELHFTIELVVSTNRRCLMSEEDYEFEIDIDQNFKLKFYDFSLKCSRPDLITVKILKRAKKGWQEIGKANIKIEEHNVAHWGDIVIGSDTEFILGGIIPDPRYEFLLLRNKGFGSKTVKQVLSYLHECGIKRVYGEISEVDNFERVSNFWTKNGFMVTKYKQPEGVFVANIIQDL